MHTYTRTYVLDHYTILVSFAGLFWDGSAHEIQIEYWLALQLAFQYPLTSHNNGLVLCLDR